MKTDFTLADFDFDLPAALIAQHPTAVRSASRLLDGRSTAPADRGFADLPQLLNAGDLLLFNDTKVVKARLFGEKASGGKLEMLIERVLPASTDSAPNREVVAHIKVSKKPSVGSVLNMAIGADGKPADRPERVGSEADIFEMLGMPYATPEQRDI